MTINDIPGHVWEAAFQLSTAKGKDKAYLKIDKKLWIGFKGLKKIVDNESQTVKYEFEKVRGCETKKALMAVL